jgi:hypothetical protein
MMKLAKRGSDTRQGAITKYHSRTIYMLWQSTCFFIIWVPGNFLFFSFSGLSICSFLVGYQSPL